MISKISAFVAGLTVLAAAVPAQKACTAFNPGHKISLLAYDAASADAPLGKLYLVDLKPNTTSDDNSAYVSLDYPANQNATVYQIANTTLYAVKSQFPELYVSYVPENKDYINLRHASAGPVYNNGYDLVAIPGSGTKQCSLAVNGNTKVWSLCPESYYAGDTRTLLSYNITNKACTQISVVAIPYKS